MHLIAEKGLLKGLDLDFEEGEEWILGSNPSQATIVLDDPSLPGRAVRITRTPEELFFIENLTSSTSLLVNDRRVDEPLLLSENDKVQIGITQFRVTQNPGTAQKTDDELFEPLEHAELPPEPEPVAEPFEEKKPKKRSKKLSRRGIEDNHDTVFEDLGKEAELPFQLAAEEPKTPLFLKVIAGPNAGAEIGLEQGRTYLLGKDPESCDIVFNDLSVSRNHARLSVSEEGIIDLEDLDSKNGTVVNGSKIIERSAIGTQHMVQMGMTIFLIIDREGTHDTIFALPPYEMPSSSPEKIEDELEVAEQLETNAEDWKGTKIPGKHLILAGSFLLIALIICLTFFSLFKSNGVEIVQKLPHEHLKEAFAQAPSVRYSFNPATGRLFMTGHLLTNTEHQQLIYNVSHVPNVTSIEDNVVVDETVWKIMNDLLSNNPNWHAVTLLSSEPGRFVARGYVPTLDQATQLADFFTMHFPYLDRLQNKVVVEEMISLEIVTLLQTKGFGMVVPQLSNGEVILAGRYSEKQHKTYQHLLDQIAKIEGVELVKNTAVPVSTLSATINITDQYKVTGTSLHDQKGYSVVINGRILTVGELLDGMKLISVESNTILLEKDGLRYKIEYMQ